MRRLLFPLLFTSATVSGSLTGCATLTDSTDQTVLVQTILDNREVANVGCILTNQAGRWFVNAPGRVTIRRHAGPLTVDCKREGGASGRDVVASRVNTSGLWGNLLVSAGAGYYVDKNTGAGFDYPSTLTVLMHDAPKPADDGATPSGGTTQIY